MILSCLISVGRRLISTSTAIIKMLIDKCGKNRSYRLLCYIKSSLKCTDNILAVSVYVSELSIVVIVIIWSSLPLVG